jgi:hypothetical protein
VVFWVMGRAPVETGWRPPGVHRPDAGLHVLKTFIENMKL